MDTAGEITNVGRMQMTTKTGEPAITQQPRGGVRGGFGGLHALDGMVILLLSIWLAIAARRRRQARVDRPGRAG